MSIRVLELISVREMQINIWEITCKRTESSPLDNARSWWDVGTVGGCGMGAELLDGHWHAHLNQVINIPCEQKF